MKITTLAFFVQILRKQSGSFSYITMFLKQKKYRRIQKRLWMVRLPLSDAANKISDKNYTANVHSLYNGSIRPPGTVHVL